MVEWLAGTEVRAHPLRISKLARTLSPAWSLTGLLGMSWPNRENRRKEVVSSIGLCGLIALQWILVSAFPLIHPWLIRPW